MHKIERKNKKKKKLLKHAQLNKLYEHVDIYDLTDTKSSKPPSFVFFGHRAAMSFLCPRILDPSCQQSVWRTLGLVPTNDEKCGK